MKIYEVSSYIIEQIQNCRGKHIILKNRKRIDREYLSILIDISFHHPFLRLVGSMKFLLIFELNRFKIVIAKNILFSRIEGGSIEKKIFKLVDIARSTRLSFLSKCESRYERRLRKKRERERGMVDSEPK